MIRALLVSATMLFMLPAMAQTAKDFAQADARAEAQRREFPAPSSNYAEAWAEFNNQHRLDERDGCYFKADGELIQILEIDESGEIVGYFSDKHNDRSRCWRRTYLGVVFPKPPFAPYWHKLVMQ